MSLRPFCVLRTLWVLRTLRGLRSLPVLRLLPALAALALAPVLGCTPNIGNKCSLSTDCSQLGDRLCDTTQPGGYCTVFNCEPDQCPNAICVAFDPTLDPARTLIRRARCCA